MKNSKSGKSDKKRKQPQTKKPSQLPEDIKRLLERAMNPEKE